MRFIPLEEAQPTAPKLRFIPLEETTRPVVPSSDAEPVEAPPPVSRPKVSALPADFQIPVEAPPSVIPPVAQEEPLLPPEASIEQFVRGRPAEATAYTPTMLQRIAELLPGDKARSLNEYIARQIARERKIPITQVYEEIGGARPIFNPEGRAPVTAGIEAAGVVAKEIPEIPAGVGTTLLRAYRAGEMPVVDESWVDKAIAAMDPMKDGKPDPNYSAFQGLGQSLGFSIANMVASITAGAGATTVTGGNPAAGVAAGMATSGTLAYRASKDEFLDRVRDKLNKQSKQLYGKPLSAEDWKAATEEFDSAATRYGLWEAIPEAVSNAIFLKAFSSPARGLSANRLAEVGNKAGALAAEQATETITALGQNAEERKAGLTNEELSIVGAFRQQFIQTLLISGTMAGGMKGKQLATDFYQNYVEPRIDPASALGRAIQADLESVGFSAAGIDQAARASLATDQSLASRARAEATIQRMRQLAVPPAEEPPAEEPGERVEPTIGEIPAPGGRAEPAIGELPPSEGVEPGLGEPAAPTAPAAPAGIGMPDVEEANIQTIQADETRAASTGATPVITTTPPSEAVTTEETQPAPAAVVENSASEGIPIVYPLVSSLKLSNDVPQFKEDADQKGVVNKLTGKFDWRDFGAIQVWQRLNGDLEVISGRHRLDLAQRSGIERVPAQIYREADGFTAQDAAILDAELNIRDEKGTVKDYVQYFKGSGITQDEAQSRGLLDNVKGTRAFAIANFGSPELVAAHSARQLSDEAAAQIALAAPQDSRLQAVGLKVRQDGKSDEAAVNAVRAVKAIAREQNTTTDMFGFDDSLIKEAVEMAKIAERKQKELSNRIAVLSKVSKNPKIAEQEGIDIKDPKAVAKRVQELKDLRAAWNNWETNPDLIDEIRQERGAFELTAETEEQRAAREAEEEATRRAEAEAAAEAERKAKADRERGEFVLTGSDRPADVAEAYGQESLFGADPTVQAWSGVKTEEMPDFKDLSPDAQQNVRDLVAQGALSKDAAREIAEDDEINRASPLRQEETIKAKVGINKGRVVTLLGQQIYGVTSEMPKVTLKELFQNAFDATKEAIEKGQIQQGNILVVFNEGDRSIEVIDNGLGMPTAVMGKEFLEIAGTKKGTKRPSGSFGIAKIQFLYGNKQLEVISLRDGVLSKMNTTGNAVQAALEGRGPAPDITISRDFNEIQQAIEKYFPEGHGTSVKVLVPDSYEDPETRQTVELPFSPWSLSTDASLRLSPLFTDVNVQVATLDDVSKRDDLFDNRWRFHDVEIGSKFPTDSYAPVTSVKFPWGNAVVYTSTKPTSTNANFNVLSNGLWQFTEQIGSSPFKPLPRSFYVDVIPKKFAGEPGYPFELNRQGFTKAAEQDINAIKKYLKVLYNQTNLAEDVKDFGTIQYINNNGTLTTPSDLKPTIPASKTPTLPTIKPTDKVEIKDGRMYVNGQLLPDISEQEMKDMKIDVDALTIDQSEIDPNKILFHNNAENKDTKASLYKMAVDKFGEDRVNKYFYGVGKTFIRLRNALLAVDPTYADMAKEGIGISLDIKYLGVNIRVPFQGMFINPAYAKISDTPAQVAVAMMGTMQHEMAHFKHRNHGSEFASEMQRINALLDTHPSFDIFALKKYFIAHMKENEDIFNFFKTEIDSGNLQPIGKRFADSSYEQIGDEGVDRSVEGAGRGREG